ncbi:MAG: ABC transporter ATP-binding protein [Alphaproteobacteria bacterium]|nr:MAG: ABC transporter ATP-binding protein [Alphaproteobacteria bacterium]
MTAGQDGRAFLVLDGLTRRFSGRPAVDGVSLSIPEGEFFTIVGPSGSGKSTLIRMLAGLERPDAGRILLRGADITAMPANRRPTCMVFQSLALFSHRSVGENIAFALKMRGVDAATRRARALELMELVRLPADYLDRPVTQCSGGERQRVALARALASDPEILFFDEPLSAIDYRLRKILEMEMKDLHARTGKTFLYITHSLEEAMVMSDRIAIMRAGRIVQIGPPREIYARPNSRFVAEFMGEVNVFAVRGGRIEGLDRPAAAQSGFLILRPEALRPLGPADHADVSFPARIETGYLLGSRSQLHLSALGRRLVAELPGAAAAELRPGQEGRWGFDLADAVVTPE